MEVSSPLELALGPPTLTRLQLLWRHPYVPLYSVLPRPRIHAHNIFPFIPRDADAEATKLIVRPCL